MNSLKVLSLILLLAIGTSSCDYGKSSNKENGSMEDASIVINIKAKQNEAVVNVLNQFAFTTNPNDSFLFLFSKQKAFDTSWIFLLRAGEDKVIKGSYIQTLPTYHRDAHDYLNDTMKLMYYEVLSFVPKRSMWGKIQEMGKSIDAINFSDSTFSLCSHCSMYKLFWNSKLIHSNHDTQPFLDSIHSVLRRTILNEILSHKKQRVMFSK